MTKYNSENVRIVKLYLEYQMDARRKSEATLDSIRKAISRYETYTGFKDFKSFNREQARAFKARLAETKAARTGEPITKATMLSTINALKEFFAWLAYQPGYKSRIHVPDIDYLNLSEKDTRIAKSKKSKEFPTLEQIHKAVAVMPAVTDIHRRDRALLAFTILTGVRDSALVSLKLKHIDLEKQHVIQDPKEVKTKFSKLIETWFFPVRNDFREIAESWVKELREEKSYGHNDPLFPRTKMGQDENLCFVVRGLEPEHWSSAGPVRRIFKETFESAGLPYFNPHSFRDTLAYMGKKICKNAEHLQAWSQNLGHDDVMTTLTSYGPLDPHRQGEIMKELSNQEVEEENITMSLLLQEIRKLA